MIAENMVFEWGSEGGDSDKRRRQPCPVSRRNSIVIFTY